jgi:hypothetical protein
MPVLQIPVEAGLVDGHDGTESHGYRWELPELRHQIGMRIGTQSPPGLKLPAKIFHLCFIDAAFQKGPGVNPGGRVPLEKDDVPGVMGGFGPKKMIESDFVSWFSTATSGLIASVCGCVIGPVLCCACPWRRWPWLSAGVFRMLCVCAGDGKRGGF